MKNIILLISIFILPLYSFNSDVKGIYAIGIFDENGNGENVQHVRKTKADYNGICYTKIFVLGNILGGKPKVTIGNSIGDYQSSKPIYNNRKIKIGDVFLYKHYTVKSGLIKVSYRNRLYDSKVFVK